MIQPPAHDARARKHAWPCHRHAHPPRVGAASVSAAVPPRPAMASRG